jgi:hypothetical protein
MDRPDVSKQTEIAWLILGYLSCYPDAKDTVEGIEHWWLNGIGVNLDSRTVQRSLDHLVKLGWLITSTRQGMGAVYGLNRSRRATLQEMLEQAPDVP